MSDEPRFKTKNIEKDGDSNIGYWERVVQTPTRSYQELFDSEKRYLAEKIPHDSVVLDIGCGDGRNIQSILENTINIFGIDNDPRAVEDAKKRFDGIGSVKIVRASATGLPFKDETFDAVTLLMILPNLAGDKLAALKEASRVLKKRAQIILSTFAETAFDERMKIYKSINAPIKEIKGTTVIFDKSIGANISEQFSLEEIKTLGLEAGLEMKNCMKVGEIAYICTFEKK